ncbi:hypothetical protein AAF712_014214 [Marasmius tenuissimus]|uniref:Uncharacterized protein n=1 Tax=Marasmius tenuissimus TaxID=585030 RepID=A0ABR2ZCQ7_9AGAR
MDSDQEELQLSKPPKTYSNLLAGGLNATCGLFWSAAYVLYVYQARKDKSYGMPVFALCLNLAWELIHTFVYPLHGIGRYIHFPWVFLDIRIDLTNLPAKVVSLPGIACGEFEVPLSRPRVAIQIRVRVNPIRVVAALDTLRSRPPVPISF